jgi:BirA family transcriptional regulator, biotin operon repressor / biotin---[acetyl-CoA-carboxylase] ligase
MPDHLTPGALRAALGERPFHCFDEVGSTQDIARDWALADPPAPDGAIVIAESQTAGRGRQGRPWHSPPGDALLVSAIYRPALAPAHLQRLTMAAGLALADTLTPLLGDAFALKWPNDGLLRGKKLCGILSEATWLGDQLAAVVIGIGLNVRIDFSGTALDAVATSLETALGRPVDRVALLAELLPRLDQWVERAADPAIVDAWRARLGTLGKRVTVYTAPGQLPSPSYTGVATDVDEAGALLVRLESGEVRRVLAGDVGLGEDE